MAPPLTFRISSGISPSTLSRPSFSRQYFRVHRCPLTTDHLRGKRLVDLDEIRVLQGKFVPLLGLVNRMHRPQSHPRRVAARVLESDELTQRCQAAGLERLFGHHQERHRAISDLRGVARRHRAADFFEHRAQFSQRLHGLTLAWAIVLVEVGLAVADLRQVNGRDFLAQFILRCDRLVVRHHRETILLLARDVEVSRDILGGLTHVESTDRIGQNPFADRCAA